MHRRFLCQACGIKWFVGKQDPDPTECPSCAGELAPLGDWPQGFGETVDPRSTD